MSAYRAGERLTPAAYRAWWPEDVQSYRALRFTTSVAPGGLDPGLEVLRIDYDLPENPPPLRRIVDELVAVQPGVYLGQALLRGGRQAPPGLVHARVAAQAARPASAGEASAFPACASQRSASSAAMQPIPAAVTAWR